LEALRILFCTSFNHNTHYNFTRLLWDQTVWDLYVSLHRTTDFCSDLECLCLQTQTPKLPALVSLLVCRNAQSHKGETNIQRIYWLLMESSIHQHKHVLYLSTFVTILYLMRVINNYVDPTFGFLTILNILTVITQIHLI
jgi:hypothetical protein